MTQTDDGGLEKVVLQTKRVGHFLVLEHHLELIVDLRVPKAAGGHDKLLDGVGIQLRVVLCVAFMLQAQTKVIGKFLAKDRPHILVVGDLGQLGDDDSSGFQSQITINIDVIVQDGQTLPRFLVQLFIAPVRIHLGQRRGVLVVSSMKGGVQSLQRRMLRGSNAIARLEALEPRWMWSNIATTILLLHLRRQLTFRVSARPRTTQLSTPQCPQWNRIIQPKSIHVRHVKGVRRLVLLLSWPEAARVADGRADKVETRLVVSLGEKVILLVDLDAHALGVHRLLRGTTLDVVRHRQRPGDVVHNELPEGHHHRGELMIDHADVGQQQRRQIARIRQLRSIVGDSRRRNAIGIVRWQQSSMTGERLGPGLDSYNHQRIIKQKCSTT